MRIATTAGDGRRQSDGFIVAKVSIPVLGIDRDVDLSFGRLREMCGETDALALDLLLVASVCYVVGQIRSAQIRRRRLDAGIGSGNPGIGSRSVERRS